MKQLNAGCTLHNFWGWCMPLLLSLQWCMPLLLSLHTKQQVKITPWQGNVNDVNTLQWSKYIISTEISWTWAFKQGLLQNLHSPADLQWSNLLLDGARWQIPWSCSRLNIHGPWHYQHTGISWWRIKARGDSHSIIKVYLQWTRVKLYKG